MKPLHHLSVLATAASLAVVSPIASAADLATPIAGRNLVFEEEDGLVAVEAEHFFAQTKTEKRAWYLTSSIAAPELKPDADPPHVGGASGGAYLEILPDTRRNAKEKLIAGENFSDQPGQLAVISYKVHFKTPGRYYLWARAYSTGAEDNGLHVGLNGQWPESGRRLQWCEGKRSWRWESKQRTAQQHCGEPYKIYLDVDKPGDHVVMFSLREDGFEFDKWFMTTNREFARPEDFGPVTRVKAGKLPEPFPSMAAAPAPPAPSAPATLPAGALTMEAADFPIANSGYYLDRGKWLAINPERNQSAKTSAPFPYPSGKYHVTLHAVGEEDGKSTYQVLVNDVKIGDFTCPLSAEQFEEGVNYTTSWRDVTIKLGDVVAVSSRIASEDGQEHSRARIARLAFEPADDATKAAAAERSNAVRPSLTPAATSKPDTGEGAQATSKVPLVLPRQPDGKGTVTISGALKQWHKVTLTLDGPFAHEQDNDPNPFTDYALTVTFTHESGAPRYVVPGYFAADGDAANTSAEAGTKWRAHLSPDKPGQWTYSVSFVRGNDIALQDSPVSDGITLPGHAATGSFTVAPTDKTRRDFRAKGRLQYVGKHHLQFAGTKEYFLKAGADAPENLLAYVDFDGTRSIKRRQARAGEASPDGLKSWQPHVQDWRPGDPTWKDGKGKGLIGALNYLAGKGCNVFSFLTYNVGGDGQDLWPFVAPEDKLHYDCSKLDQWGIVFDHGTALGLYLHFKMQEQENDDSRLGGEEGKAAVVPAALNGGDLGVERKLYCRELIARFGHALALNWNLGEENTQSAEQQRAMAQYLHQTDPYKHLIVVHTFPGWQDRVYSKLLGDQSVLSGASLQNAWNQTHQRTLKWVQESAKAGKPWVVANDEQGSASLGVPPDPGYQGFSGKAGTGNNTYDLHDIRKLTLWGNIMAGGAGVEYYFGYQLPQNDLVCQDWRSRDQSWDYCRIALEFFHQNKIPFWEMENANALVGNLKNDNSKYCLSRTGEVYLVYLPDGGTTDLDLSGANGAFTVKWFNPRTGDALQDGPVKQVRGGGKVSLGEPPAESDEDWAALVRK